MGVSCHKMSKQDKIKWNQRYSEGAYSERVNPSPFLQYCIKNSKYSYTIELGSGLGRNTKYLSARSSHIDAIDISSVAIEKAKIEHESIRNINWINADLENFQGITFNKYDLVVSIRYLNKNLLAHITNELKPGGEIVIEEHLVTDQSVIGPNNPSFRVRPKEVYLINQKLKCLFYSENIIFDPDGRKVALVQCHYKKTNQL